MVQTSLIELLIALRANCSELGRWWLGGNQFGALLLTLLTLGLRWASQWGR